ncbi:DUF6271 family protein [Apilactobacillus kunkeei]|uniref:DUF6271 family protein n=1 Tax=Apilactobacillus kunkeei TaxID=148814 RepID=UPI004034F20B
MTNEKHLYIIPTNRDARESVKSLVNDIKAVINNGLLKSNQIYFVLLDSGNDIDFKLNHHQFLKSIRQLTINSYHIPVTGLDYLLENHLDMDLSQLLIGEGFSYGKMVNKISIIANILNAQYIHRRDSDVYIQETRDETTPLIAEVCAFKNDPKCMMVGSSYIGAWGIDYSDVEDDIDTLRKLFSLSKPSYTDEQLDDYINNKYILGSKEHFDGNLIFSERKANYIDAGNFALKDIFQYIPVSPADVTSGTDYLYNTVLGKSDWKMLYHNDRVIHRYATDRYQRINHITYGDSKLLSRLMTKVTQTALNDVKLSSDFKKMNEQLSNSYYVAVHSSDIKTKLMMTVDNFIEVYSTIPHDNYKKIASHISKNKKYYVDKTLNDVSKFILLIDKWESVMQQTRNISISEFTGVGD